MANDFSRPVNGVQRAEPVNGTDIASGSALSGYVLTANGSGGSSFQASSGGGGVAAWAASTSYTAGMLVTDGNYIYSCLTNNTSGSTFAADIALGYWIPINYPALNQNKILTGSTFEDNTVGGWELFNISGYTAGTTPTTAPTLGSASSITTFQTTSSSPLSGQYSLEFASTSGAAISAGQGIISQAYTISLADQSKIFNTTFAYSAYTGSSNMSFTGNSSGTWAIYIYDVTNSAWIQPTNVYNITQGTGVGNAFCQWQTPSNMTQFRIALLCINSTGTSGVTGMMIDNVSTGQQQFPGYGVISTDWTSYSLVITATSSNPTQGSGATSTAMWRRNGGDAEITFVYSQNNAGSAGSGTYLFSLPPGLTIDTTKVVTTNNGNGIGGTILGVSYTGVTASSATPSSELGQVIAWNSTNLAILTSYSGSNPQVYGLVGSGGNSLSNNPQYYSFTAKVPIAGWSSQAQIVSQYDGRVVVMQASGSTTAASTSQPFVFTTSNYDTFGAYSTSTGKFTAPVTGYYQINWSLQASSATIIYAYINGVQNAGLGTVASNQQGGGSGIVYATAGQTIDIRPGASNTANNTNSANYLSISLIQGSQQILASDSPSYIRLDGYSGYGSTNTKIPIFSGITNRGGTDFTYATSSTLGDSITINTAGVYSVSFTGSTAGVGSLGASVNSTQLTTAIYGITSTNILFSQDSGGTGYQVGPSTTQHFNVGDVIRPHTDGTAVYSGQPFWVFSVTGPL